MDPKHLKVQHIVYGLTVMPGYANKYQHVILALRGITFGSGLNKYYVDALIRHLADFYLFDSCFRIVKFGDNYVMHTATETLYEGPDFDKAVEALVDTINRLDLTDAALPKSLLDESWAALKERMLVRWSDPKHLEAVKKSLDLSPRLELLAPLHGG